MLNPCALPAEITISVADNLVDGVLNRPRSTEVYFRGRLKDVVGKIAINQGGDRYLGSRELTVTGLIDLEDGEPAKILESTVMAVSSKGFVLSDGTSAIFVEGKADIKAGDHVTINGNKQTYAGFPSFILDECNVLSSSSAEYPEPVNITSNADEALPGFKSPVFIKVDGSNVNGTMRIADQTSRPNLLLPFITGCIRGSPSGPITGSPLASFTGSQAGS